MIVFSKTQLVHSISLGSELRMQLGTREKPVQLPQTLAGPKAQALLASVVAACVAESVTASDDVPEPATPSLQAPILQTRCVQHRAHLHSLLMDPAQR